VSASSPPSSTTGWPPAAERGAQCDSGAGAAPRALRECPEETGIIAEITGFLGIYSNPRHIVACIDGEIRQQYESTYIGCLVRGEPAINDEAGGIRFIRAMARRTTRTGCG
jgi:ADP-ribose pyrophosphatase YjhB (NUDIX family)